MQRDASGFKLIDSSARAKLLLLINRIFRIKHYCSSLEVIMYELIVNEYLKIKVMID